MPKFIAMVMAALLLTGCMASTSRIDSRDSLMTALNTQQDGYRGVIAETGEAFTIRSTSASSTKLCRVVSIQSAERYIVESFCKAKGGAWR